MSAVNKSLNVAAPSEKIRKIIIDVPNYPAWQKETASTVVDEVDAEGRPAKATLAISAMGQSATYTVAFDYSDPASVAYHLIEGDMVTKQDVRYILAPKADGTTDVTVELEVALQWALPDMMINQLALKGVKDMLKGLKTEAEK